MAHMKTRLVAATSALLLAQPAYAQESATQTVQAPSASADYVLGADDVVEIGLVGRSDFSGRLRVQSDGTIQLPLIGKVPAADRTTTELSEAIRAALKSGGYYQDPVVTAEVSSYASRYVTVLGSVVTPGLVPMNRRYRVSELLARVGGVRETAADYILIRSLNGAETKLLISELATGSVDKDPYVQAGDKIYSPPSDNFFIYGQVNAPGSYALQNGMTVRMALAKGGGLTESGSDKRISVTRDGKKVKLGIDDVLKAGDVVVIGERWF